MKAAQTILLALLILVGICGCGKIKKDTYDLVVYPDRNDLTNHIFVGQYSTAEEARDSASEYMKTYPNGDYEIGKNKIKSIGGVAVYEETFR